MTKWMLWRILSKRLLVRSIRHHLRVTHEKALRTHHFISHESFGVHGAVSRNMMKLSCCHWHLEPLTNTFSMVLFSAPIAHGIRKHTIKKNSSTNGLIGVISFKNTVYQDPWVNYDGSFLKSLSTAFSSAVRLASVFCIIPPSLSFAAT